MPQLHDVLLLVAVILFALSAYPAMPGGTVLARIGLAFFSGAFLVA